MTKSSFLLGAIAAFGALVTLSSMSQAAVIAGQPIVIKPQAGDQAFYYVNVEAPPWLACRVGQKVFFEMLGQPPFGWKWSVDASAPVMTPLPPSQFPSGHNVVAGYECASAGTGSVTWSWQGPNLPLQQEHLQMKATAALTGPADRSAANGEVSDQMKQTCDRNHQTGRQVNHVWVEGQFVLGTWKCGNLHGEYAFHMIGDEVQGQTSARTGDLTVSVTYTAAELVKYVDHMDQATADKLVSSQNQVVTP